MFPSVSGQVVSPVLCWMMITPSLRSSVQACCTVITLTLSTAFPFRQQFSRTIQTAGKPVSSKYYIPLFFKRLFINHLKFGDAIEKNPAGTRRLTAYDEYWIHNGNDPLTDDQTITAPIAYLADNDSSPEIRVYPPASGKSSQAPVNIHRDMLIEDIRTWTRPPALDSQGFELHRHPTACSNFYNQALVTQEYYPEAAAAMRAFTGALEVFIFDHNVRSSVRASRGQHGVREPVDAAHVDYTTATGPKRTREILAQFDREDLAAHRAALINLWRPITEPVLDVPLALCDVRSVKQGELVETVILHYTEDSMEQPGHAGGIYSLYYNPDHRWAYVPAMQKDEVLLLKCYDSDGDGMSGFTPHTGFKNPACPREFTPRESIELRTLVIYPE